MRLPSAHSVVCVNLAMVVLATSCARGSETAQGSGPAPSNEAQRISMKIESPAFHDRGEIPRKYTCEGDNVSPPLRFEQVPAGAQSLTLIVDDPDAPDPAKPRMTWVHWVLFNIPADAALLEEAASSDAGGAQLPRGTRVGRNDWKKASYGGPCPPVGRHRYFHEVYALDTTLDLTAPTKAELEHAMEGHILAYGELVGTYQKGPPQ